jgi:hypothetical protein
MDHDCSELREPRVDFPGPFTHHDVVVDGWRVPYLQRPQLGAVLAPHFDGADPDWRHEESLAVLELAAGGSSAPLARFVGGRSMGLQAQR